MLNMVNKMDDSTVQASMPMAMPGKRLRVLVYFIVAVTVVLTATTCFLMYEQVSRFITVYLYAKFTTGRRLIYRLNGVLLDLSSNDKVDTC